MKRMGAKAFYEREQHGSGRAALLYGTADEKMPKGPNVCPTERKEYSRLRGNGQEWTGMDEKSRGGGISRRHVVLALSRI